MSREPNEGKNWVERNTHTGMAEIARIGCHVRKAMYKITIKQKSHLYMHARTDTQRYKMQVGVLGAERAKRTALRGTRLGWVMIFNFPIVF